MPFKRDNREARLLLNTFMNDTPKPRQEVARARRGEECYEQST